MAIFPPQASRVRASAWSGRFAAVLSAGLVVAAWAASASATPFIWDQDQDRIDDRITTVHLLGYEHSFDLADTLLHQRIAVTRLGGGLVFGVFVVYDHTPTNGDFTALTLVGMPVLHRFEAIAAVRSLATFAQVQIAAGLPGVVRVEATEVLYPLVSPGVAAIGARDPSEQVFPTWAGTGRPPTSMWGGPNRTSRGGATWASRAGVLPRAMRSSMCRSAVRIAGRSARRVLASVVRRSRAARRPTSPSTATTASPTAVGATAAMRSSGSSIAPPASTSAVETVSISMPRPSACRSGAGSSRACTRRK